MAATSLRRPAALYWLGRRIDGLTPALRTQLEPDAIRAYLVDALSDRLYWSFYCRGAVIPEEWPAAARSPASAAGFLRQLSEANLGNGCWQSGWTLQQRQPGDPADELRVQRNGLWLAAPRAQVRAEPGAVLQPGRAVRLHLPKELPALSPGYYLALGDRMLSRAAWSKAVRFYWNLDPAAVPHWIRSITSALNSGGIAFELKVVLQPHAVRRSDAAVLYAHKPDYELLQPLLAGVHSEISAALRDRPPALTKSLARGLGFAEQPLDGSSFGRHRCRRLADAIVAASADGIQQRSARLDAVTERLASEGIDLKRPYLNPDSEDCYAFSISGTSPNRKRSRPANAAGDADWLAAAERIGTELCREAIWYRDRCTWLGPSADGIAYGALDADLYAGVAGVGLCLAELYAATGVDCLGRTAVAAARQAVADIGSIPPPRRLGLFAGWTGIALATARTGVLLGNEQLMNDARQLASAVNTRSDEAEGVGSDLISGRAGTVVGLLLLSDCLGDPPLGDGALRLGEQLLTTAVRVRGGYAWRTPGSQQSPALIGFSHGNAGIGYALLGLFNVSGDRRYAVAAERAFDYEQTWFDPDHGNWPDLRSVSVRPGSVSACLPYPCYWCHGAAGIALARLRAYQVLRETRWRNEALIALNTTLAMTERAQGENYSLCHGMLGNAEILAAGTRTLEGAFSAGSVTARRIAALGLGEYRQQGRLWPCGSAAGSAPGLMLGRAGIAYFFLRLAHPQVPSVLMPGVTDAGSRTGGSQ